MASRLDMLRVLFPSERDLIRAIIEVVQSNLVELCSLGASSVKFIPIAHRTSRSRKDIDSRKSCKWNRNQGGASGMLAVGWFWCASRTPASQVSPMQEGTVIGPFHCHGSLLQ